jgi:hypothetical protein
MLTNDVERVSERERSVPVEDAAVSLALHQHAQRVRRLRANLIGFALGAGLLTAGWVVHEWNANGAFERFAHEGGPGDWNPTLWAVVVLLWALVVGIMALRVHFERPATATDVARELRRSPRHAPAGNGSVDPRARRVVRARLERAARLRFHVSAWLLAMILLTPLNALIEWQDNGAFERFSRDSRPGSWDPWVLVVGAIWALAVVVVAARPVNRDRRAARAQSS